MPLRIDLPADASSPGLSRRRSLMRRPSAKPARKIDDAQRHRDIKHSLAFAMSSPRIAMELLELIIDLYVDGIAAVTTAPIPDMEHSQAAFASYIKPYTLVSKDFRYLILRRFFRTLTFSNTDDSNASIGFLATVNAGYHAQRWTGGYSWVKFLISPSFLIAPNIESLGLLTELRTMRIDFSHSGLLLQRSCLGQLFSSLTTHNIALNLTSLKLTCLPRIDVHVLTLVANGLPSLTDIHLTSAEGLDVTCCPNCYEDSLTRIVHSPVSDIYPDVTSLADAFGRALTPLKNLTRLFFGVFLSPPDMLDLHINHASNVLDITPTTAESIYNCARCAKYERITKQRELLASFIIARHLSSLETIGWSSCFGVFCENYLNTNRGEDNILLGGEHFDAATKAFASVNAPSLGQEKNTDGKAPNKLCACDGHALTTTMKVGRKSGRIEVNRALERGS